MDKRYDYYNAEISSLTYYYNAGEKHNVDLTYEKCVYRSHTITNATLDENNQITINKDVNITVNYYKIITLEITISSGSYGVSSGYVTVNKTYDEATGNEGGSQKIQSSTTVTTIQGAYITEIGATASAGWGTANIYYNSNKLASATGGLFSSKSTKYTDDIELKENATVEIKSD